MSICSETPTQVKPDWDNLTFSEGQYYLTQIWGLFSSKGYTNVYFQNINFQCAVPHLDMYVSQAKTLAKHLQPLGYQCDIRRWNGERFRGCVLFFKDEVMVHPLELFEGGVFDSLPVRGGEK